MARYALLIADAETAHPSPQPPDMAVIQQVMDEYTAYTQMLRDRGAYLAGEALQPVTTATTVRVQDGRTVTTDGPFVETKEAIGGFYIVEARDLDEAIELAAACPGAKYGSMEVRPLMELDAPAPAEVGAATQSA
jgi:hypothetical protein